MLPGGGDEEIGQVKSAFTIPLANTDVCGAINTLGSFLMNGSLPFQVNALDCNPDTVSNTYYNGSGTLDGSLGDLTIIPFVQYGAYFCGIADANGASTSAVLGGLGGFGLSSNFNIMSRDPANNTVVGRRTGTLKLFGVPAKLEAQNITWKLPVEKTGSQWGSYMTVTGEGVKWDFDGQVKFPIGPVIITMRPQIHSRGPTQTMSNGGLAFSPNVAPNVRDPGFNFSNWQNCGTNGTICPRSRVDAATFRGEHSLACQANLLSMTDGLLPYVGPYGGAGCASQDFIYFNTLENWFHFGRTGSPGVLAPIKGPKEPDNNLITNPDPVANNILMEANATLWTSLEIAAAFSVGIANITVDTTVSMASRDGFAVRQTNPIQADGHQQDVNFSTALSAQSRADADVKLTLNFTSILPSITVDIPIALGDTGDQENVVNGVSVPLPTSIHYTDPEHTTFDQYKVMGVAKSNPDSARLSCSLATTATTALPPQIDKPGPYLHDVAVASLDQIHPCHVKTCHKDGSSPVNFEWKSDARNLAQTPAPAQCGNCTVVELDLCDAKGNAINKSTLKEGDPVFPTTDGCKPH